MTYTLANYIINHFFRNSSVSPAATIYCGLFTTMPNAAGTGGVEVSGGSYARQSVSFEAPSNGISTNASSLTFSSMPAATVLGLGLFTAVTSGTLLRATRLDQPRTALAGRQFIIDAGDIILNVGATT